MTTHDSQLDTDNLDPNLLSPGPSHADSLLRSSQTQLSQPDSLTLRSRSRGISDGEDTNKRQKLNLLKCKQCRDARKKCFPSERLWPGQKCERCLKHRPEELACSKPELNTRKRGPNQIKPAARTPSVSKNRSTSEKRENPSVPPTRESDDDSASDDTSQRPLRTGVRGRLSSEIRNETPQEQTSGTAFAYLPLKEGDFRILVLQPGRKDEMVVCSFHTTSLKDCEIKYEAISYFWGRGSSVKQSHDPIELRDSHVPPRSRRILVTSSLSTALKKLRHRTEISHFWVDGLCIDRTHGTDEANRQVPMRREIFYKATNLCFWLGEDPNYKSAFNFIPKVLDLGGIDKLVRDEHAIENWSVFVALLKSPMFTRLWLVQEVAVARNVTLHSGQSAIHYQDFVDAVAMFISSRDAVADLFRRNKKPYRDLSDRKITVAERFIDVATNALRVSGSREKPASVDGIQRLLTLESLVSQLSDLGCGNARDRIFSMLALAKDTPQESEKSLGIDYSRSTMEVYQDFVIHAIQNSRSLDIICRRWANSLPDEEAKYPTWVQPSVQPSSDNNSLERTDADPLVGLPGHNNYNASKSRFVELEIKILDSTRKSLVVKGFVLDRIAKLGPRCSEGIIQYEWLELGNPDKIDLTEVVPEALWRTLVADRGPNGTNAPSWYQRALQYCLVPISPNGDVNTNKIIEECEVEAPLVVAFLRRVQSVVWNRKFVVSHAGKLGLAPMVAQEEDYVCIIYGCSVPVILRPESGGGNAWEFVGECYIHGMMEGEALERADNVQEINFELI